MPDTFSGYIRLAVHFANRIRLPESVIMVAFFMVGIAFTPFSLDSLKEIPLLFLDCYLLVQSIYLLNAYYGRESDRFNSRFRERRIEDRKTASRFLFSSVILLSLSVVLNLFMGWNGTFLILLDYFLWMFYANPKTNFKGHYLLGTATHFFSGILNFHIGFLAFSPPGIDPLLISVYYSFLFAAGHLHHMLIDFEADEASGIRTFAHYAGFNNTLNLSAGLVLFSGLYYGLLGYLGAVRPVTVLSVAAATLAHLLLFLFLRKRMTDFDVRKKYRETYRIIHALNFISIILIHGTV